MDFYYWLSLIAYILSTGYLYLIPLLLILWKILKKHRALIAKWIAIGNGWFVVANLILMISLSLEFIVAWYNQNQYEGYDFYYSGTDMFSPYGFAFRLHFITIPVSLLFLFKKFRRSILFTLIMFSLIIITNERIILLVTSFHQDYLPSSWAYATTISWWQNDVVYFITYLLIISGTYVIKQRRAKLIDDKGC